MYVGDIELMAADVVERAGRGDEKIMVPSEGENLEDRAAINKWSEGVDSATNRKLAGRFHPSLGDLILLKAEVERTAFRIFELNGTAAGTGVVVARAVQTPASVRAYGIYKA
jgi:hypothetical protein